MHDIMRERILRKLQALPDEQLYQVLDFIEFLEAKYVPGKAPQPSGLQRFAERLEDRMRGRSVSTGYIRGAIGMFGTARKVVDAGLGLVDGVVETGKVVVEEVVETGRGLIASPEGGAAGGSPAGAEPVEPRRIEKRSPAAGPGLAGKPGDERRRGEPGA